MKEEVKQERKQRILRATVRVLNRSPGASLAEIAENSGIGRATVYRYFPNREELLEELALESIRLCDQALQGVGENAGGAAQTLRLTLEALTPLAHHLHFLSVEYGVIKNPEVARGYERQTRETLELLEAMKAEGSLSLDIPTTWARIALDHLLYGAWEAVEAGEIAPKEAANYIYRTFIHGLATPPRIDTTQN